MAATSVLKLVVDDKEYSASLKNAKQGMQSLQASLEKAGKTFSDVDKGVEEYARALGDMETVSKTARGRISEMSSAFVELSQVYQQMTDQEKQSPVGQALSESLEKLKTRTIEAKTELSNLNGQLEPVKQKTGETGGIMEQLSQKFTLNVDAIKLFNAGVTAAKAVLDVAKDAFFNNEEQLDEWGRVVESSHSIYNGFLNALNTGDISGFLNNIDEITKAARSAYDALDSLNTYNAFNQINVEKTRTGMTESIADYRGGVGSKESVKAAGDAYKKELEERKKLEREAYIEAVGKVASERGVSKQDLLTALSGTYGSYQQLKNMPMSGTKPVFYGGSMFGGGGYYQKEVPNSIQERLGDALRKLNDTELQSLQALGAQAERTGNEIATVDKQINRILNGRGNSVPGRGVASGKADSQAVTGSIDEQTKKVQELQKAWRAAADDDSRQKIKAEIEEAQYALDRMVGKEKFDPSKLQEMKAISVVPNVPKFEDYKVPDITPLKQQLQIEINAENVKIDQTALTNLMKDAIQNGIDGMDLQFLSLSQQLANGIDIPDEKWQAILDQYNQLREQIGLEPIQIDIKSGGLKSLKKDADLSSKSFQAAASAISSVGSALSSIEDPTAKIMGIVAQAIANIALAFSKSSIEAAGGGPIAWIAATATGLATMISTISAIHSATGYADGGMIKGNSYSGDNIGGLVDGSQFVGLNAGEVVLNAAQQSNLASSLQGGGGKMEIVGVLTGENVVLMADRYGRRTGRGELLFGKNL